MVSSQAGEVLSLLLTPLHDLLQHGPRMIASPSLAATQWWIGLSMCVKISCWGTYFEWKKKKKKEKPPEQDSLMWGEILVKSIIYYSQLFVCSWGTCNPLWCDWKSNLNLDDSFKDHAQKVYKIILDSELLLFLSNFTKRSWWINEEACFN